MKLRITKKGYELVARDFSDGMKVLSVDDPPTIANDVWSFANDLIKFLDFWEPEKEYRSFRALCLGVYQGLIQHSYGCDAYAVESTLSTLIAKGYVIVLCGTETVETEEIVSRLSVLANYDRIVMLRRLIEERLTGSKLALELRGSQPRMSEYLRMLERAGFVFRRKEGKYVYYEADEEAIVQFVGSLFSYLLVGKEGNSAGNSHFGY